MQGAGGFLYAKNYQIYLPTLIIVKRKLCAAVYELDRQYGTLGACGRESGFHPRCRGAQPAPTGLAETYAPPAS